MNINFLGIVAAITTLLGIWIGHVSVRKIEFQSKSIIPPAVLFILLGITIQVVGLLSESKLLSAASGILGVILLWDALELFRQQNRVIKGHAPANPFNPRHARLLSLHTTATRFNLLNRDPVGHPVTLQEAILLVQNTGEAK